MKFSHFIANPLENSKILESPQNLEERNSNEFLQTAQDSGEKAPIEINKGKIEEFILDDELKLTKDSFSSKINKSENFIEIQRSTPVEKLIQVKNSKKIKKLNKAKKLLE